MTTIEFYVLSFDSTHHAVRAKKMLQKAGIKIEMIPTPRNITVSCGLSIKFSNDMLDKVKDIVDIDKPVMKLYKGIKYDEGTFYLEEEV